MAGRHVLLAGATGLVGRECLAQLIADPTVGRITALVRRALPGQAGDKLRTAAVDFDRLDESAELFRVDQVICALGTTIKRAGSKAAFRRVDIDYPLALARLARAGGARHYLLVSALGADPQSRVFYSRTKGQLEQALMQDGFASLTIVRPSLLLGDRDELRLGEEVAKRFSWATPARFKPVLARDVAAALVRAAREDRPGTRIIESAQLSAAG